MSKKVTTEQLISVLKTAPSALRLEKIARALSLKHANDLQSLRHLLNDLITQKTLLLTLNNEYVLAQQKNIIQGVIQRNKKGFGFFISDLPDDIYVSARELVQVVDGDTVLAYLHAPQNKRTKIHIIQVVARKILRIAGTYTSAKHRGIVTPHTKSLPIIRVKQQANIADGKQVLVAIDNDYSKLSGHIVSILADEIDDQTTMDTLLYCAHIPSQWSDTVLQEGKKIAQQNLHLPTQNRTDIRDLSFITIDGTDAKDLDDAVYVEKYKNGYNINLFYYWFFNRILSF